MRYRNSAKIKEFDEKVEILFDEVFADKKNDFVRQHVIGDMLLKTCYNKNDLSSNDVGWAIDSFVASKIGPMGEKYAQLHAFMVANGATLDSPIELPVCDSYGAAVADTETFKSMAFQRQSYSWHVVLIPQNNFCYDGETLNTKKSWQIHIRYCTSKRYELNYKWVEFSKLKFLENEIKVGQKYHHKDACGYYMYKDCRDRGYVVSITPELMMDGNEIEYKADRAISNYCFLDSITQSLACYVEKFVDNPEEQE